MSKEPVPQGYPSPGFPDGGGITVGKSPSVEPSIPFTDFAEVGPKGRGFGGIAWDSAKWLMREAIMPALEKLIPQGATEFASTMFNGHGFNPYGITKMPVDIPESEPGIHGVSQPDYNYPETEAFHAKADDYVRDYPDYEPER